MKQITLLLVLLAAFGLSFQVHAAQGSFQFPKFDTSYFGEAASLDEAVAPKASVWKIYRYTLFDEEIEVALPKKFTFQEEGDGCLNLQFQKGDETFIMAAQCAEPFGGTDVDQEEIEYALSENLELAVADYGGFVGDPFSYEQDGMRVSECVAYIALPQVTIYCKAKIFISDSNFYSLMTFYPNAPSAYVTRFFDSFKWIR